MQKTTILSFAVIAGALALGACNTPHAASSDKPPVEPYSNPDRTGTSGTSTINSDKSSSTYDQNKAATPDTSSQYGNGVQSYGSSMSAPPVASDEPGSLRARRDAIIDELYGEYGGSGAAKDLRKENARTGSGTGSDVTRQQRDQTEKGTGDVGEDVKQLGTDVKKEVGGAVNEADRSVFAMRCEAVGKGETPIYAGDEKAKEFFARTDVASKCAEVARISQQIHQENKNLK